VLFCPFVFNSVKKVTRVCQIRCHKSKCVKVTLKVKVTWGGSIEWPFSFWVNYPFKNTVQYYTSSMTTHICLTHWMMASGVPEIVTARSVELGNMSPATWTWAPVDWNERERVYDPEHPVLIMVWSALRPNTALRGTLGQMLPSACKHMFLHKHKSLV